MELNRRSFIKGSMLAGGAAALSGLSACASSTNSTASSATNLPNFMIVPNAIASDDIISNYDYDVVIVGAGASGTAAALSATKNGVKVAVIQKESEASSNGGSGVGIDLSQSDDGGIEALVSSHIKESQYRSDRTLVEAWARRSGETMNAIIEASAKGEYPLTPAGTSVEKYGDTDMKATLFLISPGPKPLNFGHAVKGLAGVLAEQGVDFYYSTQAIQLAKDDSGRVNSVIGKNADGYVSFSALKGIILAAGDYTNDDEMMQYYLPSVFQFGRKQIGRTGDGHKMGLWVGGQIETVCHTKMLHDMDSGPISIAEAPFLCVNEDGDRFCDETLGMSLMNNQTRFENTPGLYCQIFDSNYETQGATWPLSIPLASGGSLAALKNYMPEEEVANRTGVYESLIATYKADTLEELAGKLEIPTENLVASVKRYNEVVAQGYDDDYGKLPQYLTTVDTPPYFGIRRHPRVSTSLSGLIIDSKGEVLDENREPIPGLYAAGNCSGQFFGGVDYSFVIPGLSLGRAMTSGYIAGEAAAQV